ncbi:hypothetical protein HZP28_16005 [Elizabethkingia anophelis]|uniref:hypothetical protein n=1 Tax=Elizabethkingia anophelis TaxID=1117645 RepID=UPI0021A439A3|nr:hypothetical protein [Elizabethkingia anophelis]MCT4274276.1 hypothetical protein [Elizabethkingia anophelis]MCT4291845.1 hypothetical protein [Elizabethkingia anophelis]
MINRFETPNDFSIKKALLNGRILVEHRNLREVAQGGTEIGRLLINGKSISNDFFGGPYLYDDSHLYLSKYTKKVLKYRIYSM